MDLTARELRVLLALSLHANWKALGHGRCYPKRETLALETKLQISHISEAVRSLSDEHGVLTVVRLGRKNLYYVRAIGETQRMPPSDAVPFFQFLARSGIKLTLTRKLGEEPQIAYLPDSKQFEPKSLLLAITSDYIQGLVPHKLVEAVNANQAAQAKPESIPL